MTKKGGDSIGFKGIIYCATNLINNKKYIGQTTRSIHRRKLEHISSAYRNGKYSFHKAILKYGETNFQWSVLDTAKSIEDLDEKEIYWINHFSTYGSGGYNMSVGGQSLKRNNDNADEVSRMLGGREFLIFDLNGNFIKSRVSQTDFAREIGAGVTSVNDLLIGTKDKKQVKGYILIFKDEFNEELLKEKVEKANKNLMSKEFCAFEKKSGRYIGSWNNRETCQKDLVVSRRTITRNLDNVNDGNRSKYLFFYADKVPIEMYSKIEVMYNNGK